jgi:hypothetical protein
MHAQPPARLVGGLLVFPAAHTYSLSHTPRGLPGWGASGMSLPQTGSSGRVPTQQLLRDLR